MCTGEERFRNWHGRLFGLECSEERIEVQGVCGSIRGVN
jgi:hypothetical protein